MGACAARKAPRSRSASCAEAIAEPMLFTLKRSRVDLHSVRGGNARKRLRVRANFPIQRNHRRRSQRTMKDLRKHNGAPLKGLVLDLRDNPGGVLEAAVAVADAFLDSGVIVTAKGRTPDSKFEMDATPGDVLNGAPIVVLVNGGSASAAEIVAGALKDQHRAKLMGRTTFGKGSVQTIIPLSDDRAVKLTTSLYYTPSGVSINHRRHRTRHRAGARPEAAGNSRCPTARRCSSAIAEVKRALEELKVSPSARPGAVTTAAAPLSNAQHAFHRDPVFGARCLGAHLVRCADQSNVACLRTARRIRARHRGISRPPLPARPHAFQAVDRILVDGGVHHRRAVVYRKGRKSPVQLVSVADHLERVDPGPRRSRLLQVAAIAVCHLLLALTTPGVEVISLLYASQVVGQLAPFLLVAYLTTTLSADITEARERIENLAQTDSLTGLYNVRMFNEVWQREHEACAGKPRRVFVAHDRYRQAQGN